MNDVILDASAIIAVLKREPGAERVASVAEGARVSALTIAEVATWLVMEGVPGEQAHAAISLFRLTVEPFDEVRALAAGVLFAKTRHRGLSLGDRACLALALELRMPVFTGDRAWRDLDIGADIRLFR
jgi:PIN domain nuclease of toxin-antitoxin system